MSVFSDYTPNIFSCYNIIEDVDLSSYQKLKVFCNCAGFIFIFIYRKVNVICSTNTLYEYHCILKKKGTKHIVYNKLKYIHTSTFEDGKYAFFDEILLDLNLIKS